MCWCPAPCTRLECGPKNRAEFPHFGVILKNLTYKLCVSLALSLCCAAGLRAADANPWPAQPVTIVVPFAAGGNTDLMARIAAENLAKAFGKSFLVENRLGAGGTIAADYVARAKPDGYTLFMGTLTQISTAPFTNKIQYDPIRDFVPIVNVGGNPFVIAAGGRRGFKSIADLVRFGKENPGALNVGHAGVGGLTHLSAVLFLRRAGLEAAMIPYKGGSLVLNDVLGGQIDMYSGNLSEVLPHAKGGKLSLLAVSSDRRLRQLPDVPTLAETYPGHVVETWNGLLGPAAMPQEVVDRIAAEMSKALASPEVQARMQAAGITPIFEVKQAFAQRIQNDITRWKPILEQAGIKPE